MKVVLVLAVAIAVSSASVITRDPAEGYREGDRYFYFAGDDNVMHLVDTLEPVDEEFLSSYTRNPENNVYFLFTRSEGIEILVPNNADSIRNSAFDPSKTTVVLSHGWNGHSENEMNFLLIAAFLEESDCNIIVLDWSPLANLGYLSAKEGAIAVGRELGKFLDYLTQFGLSYERLHLVGFSLGGHLMGNAGREVGGAVKRITALDPAGPLWGYDSRRLSPSDGQYVEVMHTSSVLGYTDPLGDADFYPNGGGSQPGCWLSTCSHGRAYQFMASTIKYNHLLANECSSYREASRDRCTGTLYEMGNGDLNKSRSGIFRVNTGRNYPY